MGEVQTCDVHVDSAQHERRSVNPARASGVASAILVVERDPAPGSSVRGFLERGGHEVRVARSAEEGVGALETFRPDAVLLDFDLPGSSGLDALDRIRAAGARAPVIVTSGCCSVELAVEAMKAGAFDFLTMPVELGKLEPLIDKARREHRLKVACEYDRSHDGRRAGAHQLCGESPSMQSLKATLTQWLDVEARSGATAPPALLVGETATGKELVARTLHFNGPRRDHAFVKVTVAAIPSALIEAELFGREHGAARGSPEDGLVQAADGGTLFIDGIGDLPRAVQSKLLHLLDDGNVRRVDSLRAQRVDVRIVAATHRPLAALVSERRLQTGLYARLADMQLQLPPLRERGDDVLLLARHFTASFAARHGKRTPRLSEAAERALERHHWPGNVSELRRILERAVRLDATGAIDAARLGLSIDPAHSSTGAVLSWAADINLCKLERDTLLQALGRARGNVAHAARLLGITRDTLRYRIAKHQLAAEVRSKFRDSQQ